MRENDYTGSPIEDTGDPIDLDGLIGGYHDWELDAIHDDDGDEEYDDLDFDDDDVKVFDLLQVAGSDLDSDELLSLAELSSRLYDLADELSHLSEKGWETVGEVINGEITVVRFEESPE